VVVFGRSDARIVELVMLGMSDQEIATELDLHPVVVARRVDRLCAEVGSRNRVALAAWVGGHGHGLPRRLDR
jgi:DNA-binding NarL/FixJ family response regulator